jgi:hypothetical protein
MQLDDYRFYKEHQADIVYGHLDDYVVIKAEKVLGYFASPREAFSTMDKTQVGFDEFIIQKCQSPGSDVIDYYGPPLVGVA